MAGTQVNPRWNPKRKEYNYDDWISFGRGLSYMSAIERICHNKMHYSVTGYRRWSLLQMAGTDFVVSAAGHNNIMHLRVHKMK